MRATCRVSLISWWCFLLSDSITGGRGTYLCHFVHLRTTIEMTAA